jgi:hypothetical protein
MGLHKDDALHYNVKSLGGSYHFTPQATVIYAEIVEVVVYIGIMNSIQKSDMLNYFNIRYGV